MYFTIIFVQIQTFNESPESPLFILRFTGYQYQLQLNKTQICFLIKSLFFPFRLQLQSPALQKDLANWSLNNETQVTLIHHVRQENAKVALLSNFIWLRLK